MKENKEDIECMAMVGNDTYNTCYGCFRSWKTVPPIPGILHRTTLCAKCKIGKNKNGKLRTGEGKAKRKVINFRRGTL